MISFFVPGKPKGKGRPRATVVGGEIIAISNYGPYIRQRARPRMYTPPSTVAAEDEIKNAFLAKYRPERAIGALRMDITVRIKPPKSKGDDADYSTSKPDCDNVLKLVMDALNGLAYKDDSQIAIAHVKKLSCPKEGILVEIERINSIGGQR